MERMHYSFFVHTSSLTGLEDNLEAKTKFLEASKRFQLLFRRLYYLADDKILRLVVCPDDYRAILEDSHLSSCGFHLSKENKTRRILWKGYWWPILHEDVAKFARDCKQCAS